MVKYSMRFNESSAEFSEDDKDFVQKMVDLGILESAEEEFSLSNLARIWYERGYYDRMYEENYE